MGIFERVRRQSRKKSAQELQDYPTPHGNDVASSLPAIVLEKIFAATCPHTQDESFEACERTLIQSDCCLCDLRDLACCARVSRPWRDVAQPLLYGGIRIDAVHYCPLEESLSSQRRKKHVDPASVPLARLQLLQRSIWANRDLGRAVTFLKLPYMTRENCKGDLARIVSVLPNLRHVDLPLGFYAAQSAYQILREELEAKCPNIRKMEYHAGSERLFETLGQSHVWRCLEVLDLSGLRAEQSVVRMVLATLPVVREIRIRDIPQLDDSVFEPVAGAPNFPTLQNLTLENVSSITSRGILSYLAQPLTCKLLKTLSLKSTGVTVTSLPSIFDAAPHLQNFSITTSVSQELCRVPPLRSQSLRVLNFEITSSSDRARSTHYDYLSSSLLADALPALQKLFVCDSAFPERLLSPPHPAVAHAASVQHALTQALEIYTKGESELEWAFTPLKPLETFSTGNNGGPGSQPRFGRPVSAYHAGLEFGPRWTGEARKSVVMRTPAGDVLALPAALGSDRQLGHTRAKSANHLDPGTAQQDGKENRKSRSDLWR